MDVTHWVTHQSTKMCLSRWRHALVESFATFFTLFLVVRRFAIFCSYSSKILWLLSKKCPYWFHILNDNLNWIFAEINSHVGIETTFFKIKGNKEDINFQSLVLAFPQLLWGFVVNHAVWFHTTFPTVTLVSPRPKLVIVTYSALMFWDPVYVLDPKLQNGQKIRKWNFWLHLG